MDTIQRLRNLLEARGWTEYRLSKECGLNVSTIQNIYHRNTYPSVPTLEAICKGFGITLSEFFADSDMVELTPDLKKLFDHWISLTPEQKETVLRLLQVFTTH